MKEQKTLMSEKLIVDFHKLVKHMGIETVTISYWMAEEYPKEVDIIFKNGVVDGAGRKKRRLKYTVNKETSDED